MNQKENINECKQFEMKHTKTWSA